jgi:hypothetical protein
VQEHYDALRLLAERAAQALEDRRQQQAIFSSLEVLAPQIDMIQRLRAASRYDGTSVLTTPDAPLETADLSRWVKDALTHYWGGPRLTNSPLMRLKVVQQTLDEHQDNPANALRAILRQAIEQVRPEGERRFTAEWILYNILEMKFMEGRKVREVALRLAMSEADLYRKQRVAVEAVALLCWIWKAGPGQNMAWRQGRTRTAGGWPQRKETKCVNKGQLLKNCPIWSGSETGRGYSTSRSLMEGRFSGEPQTT